VVLAALVLSMPFVGGEGTALAASEEPATRQSGGTIDVQVIGDVIVGQPASVEFRATNPTQDSSQGSITVSFSGDPSLDIQIESGDGAKLYRPGESMFNFSSGQNTSITMPVVELYAKPWQPGSQRMLRLSLTAQKTFAIRARATFQRPNGAFVNLPASGAPDQQGAPVRLIDVQPKSAQAPPQPPTQTPVPPTATTVPPSATPAPPTATTAPAATAAPATAAPAPPPAPPLGSRATNTAVPGPTSAPAPTIATASTRSGGPAWPLLLAGLGIIAIGVAIGIVALVLILRRRADQRAAPPVWGYPPGGPYGTGPYPYPGGPYSGGPYSGEAYPSGGQQPRPPTPPATAPWDRPPTPTRDPSATPWGTQPGTAPWDRPATPAPQPMRPPSRSWPSDNPQQSSGTVPAGGREQEDATPRPPSVGGVVAGGPVTPSGERYTQRTLVGRGGMGSVYRAYDSRLRRWVALKVMHADLGMRPGFIERFIREAQVAAMLEHPNIVTIYDIEQIGDAIQMVMSWIEGEDLQHILEREHTLPPERAARLLDQLASALDNAHLRDRPVLHRDIKPSNIMVAPNDRVILTDFGIARLIGDVSLTLTGQMVGTPAYMAPELVQGEEADGRADVYAVGVVLYQMLTGQAPFRAQTPLALLHAHLSTPAPAPRTVTPTLPVAVDAVLLQALAKSPDDRYQTAGALARAFRAAIGRA
jgi:hypothetical protein